MSKSKYIFEKFIEINAEMIAIRFPESELAKGNGLDTETVNELIKKSREKHSMCHSKEECKRWIGKRDCYYLKCEMEEWREIANKKG
jgi:hypothetical protein